MPRKGQDDSCMLTNKLTGDLAYDKKLHPNIFSTAVTAVRRQNVYFVKMRSISP